MHRRSLLNAISHWLEYAGILTSSKTFLAIDRSIAAWLERNLTPLAAIRADGFVHRSGPSRLLR